jgi:hypothetical protein
MAPTTYPPYLREKARQLRRDRKLTIDQLAECLALPRTTIYYWVRDLPIPRKTIADWPESARRAGNRAMKDKYRKLREAAYEEGLATFDVLCRQRTFRDFVNLYIAEGHRRNRNTVSLANSDPAVIALAARWMERLSRRKLDCRLHYHADQDIDELKVFWGRLLGIDPGSIGVSAKSNSGQLTGRRWRSRHGVCTVRTNDTYFRARLEAWMDGLKGEWLHSKPVGA